VDREVSPGIFIGVRGEKKGASDLNINSFKVLFKIPIPIQAVTTTYRNRINHGKRL
jgi:hypothetical protein